MEACVKNHRLKEAQVHAFPQPFSPFNWKTVVSHDDYEIASGNRGRTRELEVSAAQSGLSVGSDSRVLSLFQQQNGDTSGIRALSRRPAESWRLAATLGFSEEMTRHRDFSRNRDSPSFPLRSFFATRFCAGSGPRNKVAHSILVRVAVFSLHPSRVFDALADSRLSSLFCR